MGPAVVSSQGRLREPIAQSWRRASLAGVSPAKALREVRLADVDPDSYLLAAARPVLEELNGRLGETGMCTVLVDPEGRVAHRWCGDRAAATKFDALGIGVGASLSEDVVGTNGPGTALETRSSIVVNAGEHFAEGLRIFSCYGHPIFHPATRRLEGALDITVLATEANPLLGPLIAKAVADIEQHLLEGSRVSERVLLAAFQSAARRARPVIALGEDLLLSNQAAADLLDSSDVALLRNLVGNAVASGELKLELRSGQRARVCAERVAGARSGVLIRIQPETTEPARSPVRRRAATRDVAVGHVHITGPTGSGRSSEARERWPVPPRALLTAAQALLGGSAAWAEDFATALRDDTGAVCIDDVDLLPCELVDVVAAHGATGRGPRLVLTSGPLETLSGPVRALTASCSEMIELLPLAHRIPELPRITARMLDELGARQTHHLTPGTLRVLGSYNWPGNLTELRAALTSAVRRRTAGAVVPADLPEVLVTETLGHDLGPIERAERNAIIAAMRAAQGNKLQAARSLGISRTTLYARMRSLRVQTY